MTIQNSQPNPGNISTNNLKESTQLTYGILLFILGCILYIIPIIGQIISPLLILYTLLGFKVIYDYERGVVFTMGKYTTILKGGIVWVAPFIQSLIKLDLRVNTLDIPKQEVITKDNVPLYVNGVLFYRIIDPMKVVMRTQDYKNLIYQYAQTTLRDIIGEVTLDELLQHRDQISNRIRQIVDTAADVWGIDIIEVKLQDIELPDQLKRAISRQAEAEREKRAIIIKSEGEIFAAKNISKAAEILAQYPNAIYLRLLYTLTDISKDPSQKLVIFLPEVIRSFFKK